MSPGTTTNKASIHVTLRVFMLESDEIPKYVEVFDSSLTSIKSFWVSGRTFTIPDLDKGFYMIRLTLSSGVQEDVTVKLEEAETKKIEIDISSHSPHETHEWAFFTKNISLGLSKSNNLKMFIVDSGKFRQIEGKLWKYTNSQWTAEVLPQFLNQTIFSDGRVYHLDTQEMLSVLEISGENMPLLFVNLPPRSRVNCLIKLADAGSAAFHPLDVTVATNDKVAETLLALLTSGAMREAETLTKDYSFNAEMLLMGKVDNPISAAIGGYFLLKVKQLDRLHDWPNNLANWFTWMPDGPIIHAWQLMAETNKTPEIISRIRARLLEAVDRGIPIYNEGLRLLYEGLTQLWYFTKKSDIDVEAAIKKISGYVEAVDWSQETTTFTGTAPGLPGKAHLKSKESPDLAIVTAVDDEELTAALVDG